MADNGDDPKKKKKPSTKKSASNPPRKRKRSKQEEQADVPTGDTDNPDAMVFEDTVVTVNSEIDTAVGEPAAKRPKLLEPIEEPVADELPLPPTTIFKQRKESNKAIKTLLEGFEDYEFSGDEGDADDETLVKRQKKEDEQGRDEEELSVEEGEGEIERLGETAEERGELRKQIRSIDEGIATLLGRTPGATRTQGQQQGEIHASALSLIDSLMETDPLTRETVLKVGWGLYTTSTNETIQVTPTAENGYSETQVETTYRYERTNTRSDPVPLPYVLFSIMTSGIEPTISRIANERKSKTSQLPTKGDEFQHFDDFGEPLDDEGNLVVIGNDLPLDLHKSISDFNSTNGYASRISAGQDASGNTISLRRMFLTPLEKQPSAYTKDTTVTIKEGDTTKTVGATSLTLGGLMFDTEDRVHKDQIGPTSSHVVRLIQDQFNRQAASNPVVKLTDEALLILDNGGMLHLKVGKRGFLLIPMPTHKFVNYSVSIRRDISIKSIEKYHELVEMSKVKKLQSTLSTKTIEVRSALTNIILASPKLHERFYVIASLLRDSKHAYVSTLAGKGGQNVTIFSRDNYMSYVKYAPYVFIVTRFYPSNNLSTVAQSGVVLDVGHREDSYSTRHENDPTIAYVGPFDFIQEPRDATGRLVSIVGAKNPAFFIDPNVHSLRPFQVPLEKVKATREAARKAASSLSVASTEEDIESKSDESGDEGEGMVTEDLLKPTPKQLTAEEAILEDLGEATSSASSEEQPYMSIDEPGAIEYFRTPKVNEESLSDKNKRKLRSQKANIRDLLKSQYESERDTIKVGREAAMQRYKNNVKDFALLELKYIRSIKEIKAERQAATTAEDRQELDRELAKKEKNYGKLKADYAEAKLYVSPSAEDQRDVLDLNRERLVSVLLTTPFIDVLKKIEFKNIIIAKYDEIDEYIDKHPNLSVVEYNRLVIDGFFKKFMAILEPTGPGAAAAVPLDVATENEEEGPEEEVDADDVYASEKRPVLSVDFYDQVPVAGRLAPMFIRSEDIPLLLDGEYLPIDAPTMKIQQPNGREALLKLSFGDVDDGSGGSIPAQPHVFVSPVELFIDVVMETVHTGNNESHISLYEKTTVMIKAIEEMLEAVEGLQLDIEFADNFRDKVQKRLNRIPKDATIPENDENTASVLERRLLHDIWKHEFDDPEGDHQQLLVNKKHTLDEIAEEPGLVERAPELGRLIERLQSRVAQYEIARDKAFNKIKDKVWYKKLRNLNVNPERWIKVLKTDSEKQLVALRSNLLKGKNPIIVDVNEVVRLAKRYASLQNHKSNIKGRDKSEAFTYMDIWSRNEMRNLFHLTHRRLAELNWRVVQMMNGWENEAERKIEADDVNENEVELLANRLLDELHDADIAKSKSTLAISTTEKATDGDEEKREAEEKEEAYPRRFGVMLVAFGSDFQTEIRLARDLQKTILGQIGRLDSVSDKNQWVLDTDAEPTPAPTTSLTYDQMTNEPTQFLGLVVRATQEQIKSMGAVLTEARKIMAKAVNEAARIKRTKEAQALQKAAKEHYGIASLWYQYTEWKDDKLYPVKEAETLLLAQVEKLAKEFVDLYTEFLGIIKSPRKPKAATTTTVSTATATDPDAMDTSSARGCHSEGIHPRTETLHLVEETDASLFTKLKKKVKKFISSKLKKKDKKGKKAKSASHKELEDTKALPRVLLKVSSPHKAMMARYDKLEQEEKNELKTELEHQFPAKGAEFERALTEGTKRIHHEYLKKRIEEVDKISEDYDRQLAEVIKFTIAGPDENDPNADPDAWAAYNSAVAEERMLTRRFEQAIELLTNLRIEEEEAMADMANTSNAPAHTHQTKRRVITASYM